MVYDRFTQTAGGQSLLDTALFPNPSLALGLALESRNLRFVGVASTTANGGNAPVIFAPSPFEGGSSYSHFDEATYPAGNPNSLMTPYLDLAEAIHAPGPLGLGLLKDIGWRLSSRMRGAALPSTAPSCSSSRPETVAVK